MVYKKTASTMENILSRLIIWRSVAVPLFLERSESEKLKFRRHVRTCLAKGFDVLTLPIIAAFFVWYRKCMLRQSITVRIRYLGDIWTSILLFGVSPLRIRKTWQTVQQKESLNLKPTWAPSENLALDTRLLRRRQYIWCHYDANFSDRFNSHDSPIYYVSSIWILKIIAIKCYY